MKNLKNIKRRIKDKIIVMLGGYLVEKPEVTSWDIFTQKTIMPCLIRATLKAHEECPEEKIKKELLFKIGVLAGETGCVKFEKINDDIIGNNEWLAEVKVLPIEEGEA